MSRLDLARIERAQAERKTALTRALAGMPPATADVERAPPPAVPSFDGGARRAAPLPGPSHGEWLMKIITDRRADVGGSFGP
jgi:hypothetical protein